MRTILVVSPHPDDETLGCGGTLLRHKAEGCAVHWVIATAMRPELGYAPEKMAARDSEIHTVAERYGFASIKLLGFPTTRLETFPRSEVIARMGEAFRAVAPHTVYLPFPGDAHSDHKVVFEAAMACCKWFRFPSVRRVLAYETLSETDANPDPESIGFRPNVFMDISAHLAGKIAILELFAGETAEFPFPRSQRALTALAELRGAACGARAAEAFMLLRETL